MNVLVLDIKIDSFEQMLKESNHLAELDNKLQRSYAQSLNGQGVSANQFFDELEKDFT